MNMSRLLTVGFPALTAEFLIDCERGCNQHYEYETTHEDAAAAYEDILIPAFGLDPMDIISVQFTNNININNSMYLGNEVMEIQMPRKFTYIEAEYFSLHTDYVIRGRSDKAYISYPSIAVVAYTSYTILD